MHYNLEHFFYKIQQICNYIFIRTISLPFFSPHMQLLSCCTLLWHHVIWPVILYQGRKQVTTFLWYQSSHWQTPQTYQKLHLMDRREVLCERLFKRHVLLSDSLLHYLLPQRCENDTVNSLRDYKPFHTIWTQTNKFCNSFIPYSLNRWRPLVNECNRISFIRGATIKYVAYSVNSHVQTLICTTDMY